MLIQKLGQLALAFNELVHLLVAHRLGKLVVHLFVFLHQVHYLLHAFLYHFLDSLAVVKFRFLRQITHAVARRESHVALVVLVDAGNNLEQGGFP